jgi:hypothetical protein
MLEIEPFWILLGYTLATYTTLVIVASQYQFQCA